MTADEYRTLLLQFIGSLTLADHMGDVGNSIVVVLKRLGIAEEWDELSDLGNVLGRMGVTTLHGTNLTNDETKG